SACRSGSAKSNGAAAVSDQTAATQSDPQKLEQSRDKQPRNEPMLVDNQLVMRETSTSGGPSIAEQTDRHGDGFPDLAELHSFEYRQSFRKWLATIAEMQFYSPSDEWSRDQRDCAGLVRFSIREALRKHDRAWFKRMGAEYEPVARDVEGAALGDGP